LIALQPTTFSGFRSYPTPSAAGYCSSFRSDALEVLVANPFFGEIKILAFDYAPPGWALCDGQTLSIAQNQPLYSLLGTSYGGDGVMTFALPDMRGRTPVHTDVAHTLAQKGGATQVTLLSTQVPLHSHGLVCSGADAVSSATQPAGRMLARATAAVYADPAPATALSAASVTASTGMSQTHSNMQPYLTLNFVIALTGVFPSRP
jgi:microcystin-dependent protein